MDVQRELRQLDRHHIPSYARGLVRLAKKALRRSSDLNRIISEVRRLRDPYYSGFGLSGIAKAMYMAGIKGYDMLFIEACMCAGHVKQEWRRVEIISKITTDMTRCKITDFSAAFDVVAKLKEKTQRKEAFRRLAKVMAKEEGNQPFSLLNYARDKKEMSKMLKWVINESLRFNTMDIQSIKETVLNIEDSYVRCKGLIFLGIKASQQGQHEASGYYEMAVKTTYLVDDEGLRFELLMDITDKVISSVENGLSDIILAADYLGEEYKASLLAYTAKSLFKQHREGYDKLYLEALATARKIQTPRKRYKSLQIIATGMEQAGLKGNKEVRIEADLLAKEIRGLRGTGSNNEPREDKSYSCPENNLGQANDTPVKLFSSISRGINTSKKSVTMGLYNTYEKKLSSAHVRAVARAAPLCYAFGLKLGLFGFPFRSTKEAVEKVGSDSKVDKGGFYLKLLEKEDRFFVYPSIHEKDLGILVATTPKPHPNKLTDLVSLKKVKKLCIFLGVGKTGLPNSVLSQAKYHLEFSGKNIPFETSTAMGILAYMLKDI